MNRITIPSLVACLLLAGCQTQTIQDPYVISGNTISYQHKSDPAAINKASADAKSQCAALQYQNVRTAHSSCSAGECVTKFVCE